MEKIWGKFDKIYCINLKSRDDKYNYCRNLFGKLKMPVIFYRVDVHPTNRVQGCFESHLNLVKKAYDDDCQNVLILEDDIKPSSTGMENPELLSESVSFMKENDWDIFYLGLCPHFFSLPEKIGKRIYKLNNACTHAYVLNRPYMKKIKDLKFSGVPIDSFYGYDKKKSYGIYPSIFYQNNFNTDIQFGDNIVDKIRENFIQAHKPTLLSLYETFIIYRFEFLAILILGIFCFLILISLSRRKNNSFVNGISRKHNI